MTTQAIQAHLPGLRPAPHQMCQLPLSVLLFEALRYTAPECGDAEIRHWQWQGQQDYLRGLETGLRRHFWGAAEAFHRAERRCLIGSPRQRHLRQWVLNSFDRSSSLMRLQGNRIYLTGQAEALLLRPDPDKDRNHCVILLNDLSSFKEIELFYMARTIWLPEGFTCLLVDGPGQGALAFDGGLPVEFEQIVQGAISHLMSARSMDRFGFSVLGLGLGGHLALRAVSRLASVDCAINLGGPFNLVDAMPELSGLAEALAFSYRRQHPEDLHRLIDREYSLACLPAPQRPVLSLHWEGPGFMPLCEADKIDTWAGQNVDSRTWPGTSDSIIPALEQACSWLLDQID